MLWSLLLLTSSVFGFNDPSQDGLFDWVEPPGGGNNDESRAKPPRVVPMSPHGPNSMSGSPYGPNSMPGSPYGPNSMSGSPYGPNSMSGSPYGPNSMRGSPYGPMSMSGSPNGPDSMSGSPYGPGSMSGSPYGPGSMPGSPYGPNSMSRSPYGPDSMSGSPYGPDSMSGSPYGPESIPGLSNGPPPISGSPEHPGSMRGSKPGSKPGSPKKPSLRETFEGPFRLDDNGEADKPRYFNQGPLPEPRLSQGQPNVKHRGMPTEKEVDDMEKLITKYGKWPEFLKRLKKEGSKWKNGEVDHNWEESLKDWVEWTQHLKDGDEEPSQQISQSTLRPILHVAAPKIRVTPSPGFAGYWGDSEEYIPAYALRNKPELPEETENSPDFSDPRQPNNDMQAAIQKVKEARENNFQPNPEQEFTWNVPPPPNDDYSDGPPQPPPGFAFPPPGMPQHQSSPASSQSFNIPMPPYGVPGPPGSPPYGSSFSGLPRPEKPMSNDQGKAPVPLRNGPSMRQENQKRPDTSSMVQMILKKISVLEDRVSEPRQIKTTTQAPSKPVNPMSLINNARRRGRYNDELPYALRSRREPFEDTQKNLDFSDREHIHNTIHAAIQKIEDESGARNISWMAAQSQFQPKPDKNSPWNGPPSPNAELPPPPPSDGYAPPLLPSDGYAPVPPVSEPQYNMANFKHPAASGQFNMPMYDAIQPSGFESLGSTRWLPRPEKQISPYEKVKAKMPLRNGPTMPNAQQPDTNSMMQTLLNKLTDLEIRVSEPPKSETAKAAPTKLVKPRSRRSYVFDETVMRMALRTLKDGTANKSHEMLRNGDMPIKFREAQENRLKLMASYLEPPTTEAELRWPLSELDKTRQSLSAMSPDEFISTRHSGNSLTSRRKSYGDTGITREMAINRLKELGALTPPPPPDSNEVLDLLPPDMISDENSHPSQKKSQTTTINPVDLAPFADFFDPLGTLHSGLPDRSRRQDYPIVRSITRRADDEYAKQLAIAKKKVQEMEKSPPKELKALLDRQGPPLTNIPAAYKKLPSLGPGFPPNRPSPSDFGEMPKDLVWPVSQNAPPNMAYGGIHQDNSSPDFKRGVPSPHMPPNFSYKQPPASGTGPRDLPSFPGSNGPWGYPGMPPSGDQGAAYNFPPDFAKRLQEMQSAAMQAPQMSPPMPQMSPPMPQMSPPMPQMSPPMPEMSPPMPQMRPPMRQMLPPLASPLQAVRQEHVAVTQFKDRPQVSSNDLMAMLMKKLEGLETRLDHRDKARPAPPKILPGFPVDDKAKKAAMRAKETQEEMEFFKKLPFEDDNEMPIRWVKYNSNETEDGLAKVTDLQSGKNMQFIFQGVYYVPVIDHAYLQMGSKMELTTQPVPLSFSTENNILRTVLENVDMSKPKPEDWLAYETVLGKFPNEDACEAESCQAGCHRTGCQSMCEGDSCKVGCVGPGCTAACKGPGCSAMCIGERCSARCDGMTCDSRCRGINCDAVCSLFSCTFTINGASHNGKGTFEEWYPDHTR